MFTHLNNSDRAQALERLEAAAKSWGIPVRKMKTALHWETLQKQLKHRDWEAVRQFLEQTPAILSRYDVYLSQKRFQRDLQLQGMIAPHLPWDLEEREQVLRQMVEKLRSKPTLQHLMQLLHELGESRIPEETLCS